MSDISGPGESAKNTPQEIIDGVATATVEGVHRGFRWDTSDGDISGVSTNVGSGVNVTFNHRGCRVETDGATSYATLNAVAGIAPESGTWVRKVEFSAGPTPSSNATRVGATDTVGNGVWYDPTAGQVGVKGTTASAPAPSGSFFTVLTISADFDAGETTFQIDGVGNGSTTTIESVPDVGSAGKGSLLYIDPDGSNWTVAIRVVEDYYLL